MHLQCVWMFYFLLLLSLLFWGGGGGGTVCSLGDKRDDAPIPS